MQARVSGAPDGLRMQGRRRTGAEAEALLGEPRLEPFQRAVELAASAHTELHQPREIKQSAPWTTCLKMSALAVSSSSRMSCESSCRVSSRLGECVAQHEP